MTRTVPANQAQNPAAATRGKASERAPSCSGTAITQTPSISGSSAACTSPTRYPANSWVNADSWITVSSPSIRSKPRTAPSAPTIEQSEHRPTRSTGAR